jgi:hypothetical protein
VVVKACNGYSAHEVDQMGAAMYHLQSNGFGGACRALPKLASVVGSLGDATGAAGVAGVRSGGPHPDLFASTVAGLPAPTLVLSLVPGIPADKAIAQGADPLAVLRAIGDRLGEMHAVSRPLGSGHFGSARASCTRCFKTIKKQ